MKRRRFIQTTVAAAAATPLLLHQCQGEAPQPAKEKITGFIFSDAHIGWDHPTQPTQAAQQQAIKTIVDYFGDLDLVFDTGDVHHGNLLEDAKVEARDFWLTEMAGQFPQALFHYIPGNHELARGINDVELTVGKLGSFALRPYYSFDYQGIHFISLPQLQDTILITRETLNWLAQDLALNQDKTTLVFSHNSIKGTTFDDKTSVYRVTVNSDEVTDLLDKHNNVIAWFHGHNHQYEIVKKAQRLYVSNGRIGGFDPPAYWGDFGQGHLGGVYFEIDSEGLTVKCFSATQNDFFENFGLPHLSNQVQHKTSLNAASPVNYYWGHGMFHGCNTHEYHNHYLSHQASRAFVTDNNTLAINTNHDLRFGTVYTHANGDRNKAMGYHIVPRSVQFKKVPTGLQIVSPDAAPYHINLPVEKYMFGNYLSRSGYYRCGPGARYQLDMLFTDPNTADLQLQYKVMDRHHVVCYQSAWVPAAQHGDTAQFDVAIPDAFSPEPHDHRIYLFMSVRVDNAADALSIKSICLLPKQPGTDAKEKISMQGQYIDHERPGAPIPWLSQGSGLIKAHDVVRPKTLYIKTPEVKWQVRNATATITPNGLVIQKPRHHFSQRAQVIITPTTAHHFYVSELVGITHCQIAYFSRRILIDSIKVQAGAMLVVIANKQPVKVEGAVLDQSQGSRHSYQVNNEQVLLVFA